MSQLVKVENTQVIHIDHGQPWTTSIAIAEGVGLDHKNVISIIRKFKSDFEEFGTCAFQTRKSKGRPTEYADLNEDQATYLMTLFKNTDVVRRFKITLVKAFRSAIKEIERLNKQRTNTSWQESRITQKAAQKLTNSIVKTIREENGKITSTHHYINEELLLNELVTGIRASTNRDDWLSEDIDFAMVASTKNASLAIRGLSNKERRQALLSWAATARPSSQRLNNDGGINAIAR